MGLENGQSIGVVTPVEQQTPQNGGIVPPEQSLVTALQDTRASRMNRFNPVNLYNRISGRNSKDSKPLGKVVLAAGGTATVMVAALGSGSDSHAQGFQADINSALSAGNAAVRSYDGTQTPSSAAFDAAGFIIANDDNTDPVTATPTEEVNENQVATATPEAQAAELPFAGSLDEVQVAIDEDITDGFRTMTSELVNKDGTVTSITIHFTAKPNSSERTNTASPEHALIQKNTIQALTRYKQILEGAGTIEEKRNWDKVMEAHARVTEPRKPRTSPNETPLSQRVYFLSKKDPSVPGSYSLLSSSTEYYERSSSTELLSFTETYANALNNATDHLGKDRRYGNIEYRQRYNTSMDFAQIANKLRQQEMETNRLISIEGFNPAKGADGVDGKALEQAANYMPAKMAAAYILTNSIMSVRPEQKNLFEDPIGEMEKLAQEWTKRDTMGRIRLMGNELGQSDTQTAPHLPAAAELIATN